jgi:ferric-dicitrate binding protein FerR (iron transport regulator)
MSDEERGRVSPDANRAADPPTRVSSEPSPGGDLVRRYLRRPHGASERRSWARFEAALLARGHSDPRAPDPDRTVVNGWPRGADLRRRWGAAHALTALLGIAGLAGGFALLVRRPGTPAAPAVSARPNGEARTPAPATTWPTPAAVAADEPPRRMMALGDVSSRVAPGSWTIAGQASVDLAPGSAARARIPVGESPILTLLRGRIALAVVPKPRPTPFRITAGPYDLTVLGTRFTVERRSGQVNLVVSEGRVAVARAGRRLTVVAAGGAWSGEVAPESTADTGGADPLCGAVAGGRPGPTALPCLRVQAAGAGLRAQIALFHIGRINQEDLGEPAAALATYEELRRRFPRGPLRAESDLSIVQLLATTGRHGEALDESAALLARGSSPERAGELHLLRGDLYREALQDLAQAEREYRLAAEAGVGPGQTLAPPHGSK